MKHVLPLEYHMVSIIIKIKFDIGMVSFEMMIYAGYVMHPISIKV